MLTLHESSVNRKIIDGAQEAQNPFGAILLAAIAEGEARPPPRT
jgi:hypothetical protein